MTDKQIIIEDCPHFIGGCCQEYLDGVCENHKCDLKIIRELEQKLKAKEQECEELKSDNLQEVGQLKFAIGTLTAENLHLKELLDMRIEALCDSCKAGSMLPIKCRIYEKTLTEIKEIAEKRNYLDYNECLDDILQKIGECEGDKC